jgi:hypothetical protein
MNENILKSPTEILGQVHQRFGRVTLASIELVQIGSIHRPMHGSVDIGLPPLRIIGMATYEMHREQVAFVDSLTGETRVLRQNPELYFYCVEALD